MEKKHFDASEDLRPAGTAHPIPLHPQGLYLDEEYPFEANFIRSPLGPWMHYVDQGEGPVVLMVHGNPTWSFMYRNLIGALSPRYRCVAPDHIGCGRSEKPQDHPYLLEHHIDALERLILALDLKDITLVVHDWGGAIGLGAAARHPQRFKALVAFNTSAFWMPWIPASINACRIPGLGELLIRGGNAFALGALAMATARPFSMPFKVMKGFVAPYDNWKNRIATLTFVRDIPLRRDHPSLETLRQVERGMSHFSDKPFLLMWGMRDFCFTPIFLEEWARRLNPERILRFPEAGHYLLEDAGPQALEAITDFLSGLQS